MRQPQAPIPTPGETFEQYAVRAHPALLKTVPDFEDRNELVERTYRKYCGLTAAEKAARKKHDPKRHQVLRNVCEWAEHEVTDPDGSKKYYGLDDLAEIVRQSNKRISDRHAFPAISKGHTSSDPGHDPEIFGYVGSYRLGMVGNENPRWAVFADEFHDTSKVDQIKERPRRSVELWEYRDGQKYFDPVATLGADAPRLPLPVSYSSDSNGAQIRRYSAVAPIAAPAYPGGVNTAPKKPVKRRYEGDSMLAQDDIRQLMEALQQTPEFQFIRQKMQSEQQPEPGPGEENAYMGNHYEADQETNEDSDAAPYLSDPDDTASIDELLSAPEDDKEPMKMSANQSGEVRRLYAQIEAERESFKNNMGQMQRQYAALSEQVAALSKAKADGDRREVLRDLSTDFPHMVDFEEEVAHCCYSGGSQMTDEAFQAHVAQIKKYAAKAPTHMIPNGETQQSLRIAPQHVDAEKTQYQAKVSELATKIGTDHVNDHGTAKPWSQCMEEAKQQLQATG